MLDGKEMIGQKLGSFLIEEQIGAGAMGIVYRALHEKTATSVALKIILNEAGAKGKITERFDREAKILQTFKHPHIVKWLGHGRYQGTGYFAMEYLTGGTLEDRIDRNGALPWREMVDMGIQISDALSYAHDNQVVHRDLKPSNLLFSQAGQIKLTDFGIAKDLDPDAEALTATGRTLGTSAYMAPEQIRGTPAVSHKTDLYALGCLFYQMLTGEIPFKGSSAVVLMHLHLSEPPPRASAKATDIPKALDNLILQLMSKDSKDRPRDAQKVHTDLIELREKAAKGVAMPKVFNVPASPTRMGAAPNNAIIKTEREPTESEAKKAGSRKSKAKTKADSEPVSRKWIWETIGLATAFVSILALTAYLLWPTSAAVLHKQAADLMASDNPSDWSRADREPIAELDRRFPNLYGDEKSAWRDRILLEKTHRRAAILEKPNLGPLSDPKTEPERMFVEVFNESTGAVKDGREEEAMKKWQDLAELTSRPDDRGWKLLAQERVAGMKADMTRRLASVVAQLEKANRLERDGKKPEADEIRKDVTRRYGKSRYLQDEIRKHVPQETEPPKTSS